MALWSRDGRQISGFPGDSAPRVQPFRAQPIQPPSQGTPYGQQPSAPRPTQVAQARPADFSVYRPPQATAQSAAPVNPSTQANTQQAGNVFQRPRSLPSFQFSATDSFGNTYDNPAALTAQQGAMAQAMNAQRAQQIQSGNIGRLDPMAAYQQAQNMVQGGWTNPFAPGQARPVQPQSQGTPYGALGNIGTSLETHGTIGLGSPAQPPGVHRHSPNDTLQYAPGPYWPGTYQPIAWGPDRRMGTADDQPPARPSQAQPIQPPSQGTPYGQPMPFDQVLQQNIDYTLGQQGANGRPTVRSQMLQEFLRNVSPNDPAFRQKVMELNPATDTVREVGGRLGEALRASGAAESALSRAGREFARNEMYADSRARTIAAGRSDSGPPQWEGSRVNGVSSGAYGMGPGGQINFTPAGQAQPIQPPSPGTQYRPGAFDPSIQAPPRRQDWAVLPDGRRLYSGPPETGLQAPPRRALPPEMMGLQPLYAPPRRQFTSRF